MTEKTNTGANPSAETASADERFMRQALVEAEAAKRDGEVPIGAVVVCQGRIISRAHNLTETLGDATAHAEMQAITSAAAYLGGKYLRECTLYVTLEPCIMCAGALAWSQIQRIVYGAPDPRRGYTTYSPRPIHPRTEVSSGVLADECLALVRQFFKEKR